MTMAATVLSPVSSVPSHAHVEGDTVSDLARWLTEQVAKQAARVVLAQRVAESGHHTVDEWTTADLVDARALADVIYGAAMRDAQALRTSLTYGVFAIRADRPEPIGRYFFRIESGLGWQPSDTPDERGVVAMLMRHTEASARLSLGHSRGILDQYERLLGQNTTHYEQLLQQAYGRIAALEAREMEALEIKDKLQSMARERELELAKLAHSANLRMLAIDKLSTLAPLLLAKLGAAAEGGGEGSPAGGGAAGGAMGTLEVLEQLIVSITSEQFSQVVALLRPEQIALLAHLYDVVEARQRKGGASSTPPAASPPPATAPTPEKNP
jgi:hypothetical protein